MDVSEGEMPAALARAEAGKPKMEAQPMAKPVIIVIGTLIVAAAVIFAVPVLLGGNDDILGPELSWPDVKLTVRLPAGWSQQKPPEELKQRFDRPGSRYLGHFSGPELGDSCDLIIFDSTDRLYNVREEILQGMQAMQVKTLENEFTRIPPEGGVPAWVHQFVTGSKPIEAYGARVVLDRGDKKVMMSYMLSAPSVKIQHEAILASISSIRLN